MTKQTQHRINAGRVAILDQVGFLTQSFGQASSMWKEDDTRVTFVDFAISERVGTALARDFPLDTFCSEEGGAGDEALPLRPGGFAWVLDPVDGTNNYALGLPFCGISLALLRDGVPIYGFVYDFARSRLIEGGPGYGLLDGHRRVSPPQPPLSRQSLIGFHFPLPAEQAAHWLPLLQRSRLRSLGSGALHLAYVALGFLDGMVDFRVKVWDIAAGHALVRAANRRFLFLQTDPFPMRTFTVQSPSLPCIAGTQGFAEYALSLAPPIPPSLARRHRD